MDQKNRIIKLLEQNDKSNSFTFFHTFDATKRGAYFVLDYLLKHEEEVISVDLSNALNVSTARMTKLLMKMEQKKLITKRKSPEDARKTIVEITNNGKEQFLEYKNLVIEYLISIVNEIGVDKFEEYLLITSKIKSITEEKYVKRFAKFQD